MGTQTKSLIEHRSIKNSTSTYSELNTVLPYWCEVQSKWSWWLLVAFGVPIVHLQNSIHKPIRTITLDSRLNPWWLKNSKITAHAALHPLAHVKCSASYQSKYNWEHCNDIFLLSHYLYKLLMYDISKFISGTNKKSASYRWEFRKYFCLLTSESWFWIHHIFKAIENLLKMSLHR